jgi:4-hydroxybenzoate polyprenyltransferase
MLGHIGLFSGLYVAAAFVSLAQLAGIVTVAPPLALVSLTLLATAAYALDRVKLRDRWIDPSDIASQPDRYAFLQPRARTIRTLAFLMLLLGGALGLTFTHWAPLATILIPLGVAVYAARPRGNRPRPKDILGLKNTYVAAGIVGFSLFAAVAIAAPADTLDSWRTVVTTNAAALAAAAVLLALRVFLDAAVCDLDDENADRRFGTATLATKFGHRRAWNYTAVLRVILIIAIPLALPCPWRPRIVWTAASILGMLSLRLTHPEGGRVRDWVDIRLPIEAALATTTLWLWSNLT